MKAVINFRGCMTIFMGAKCPPKRLKKSLVVLLRVIKLGKLELEGEGLIVNT